MSKPTPITFGTEGIAADTLADKSALSALVRRAIASAIENGLEPDLAAPHPRQRHTIGSHLTAPQFDYLTQLMKKQGVRPPLASAVGRLVDAGLRGAVGVLTAPAAEPPNALTEVLASLGQGARPEQSALFRHIGEALNRAEDTGIVAAQGTTGVGKTTVAHALAVEWLRGNLRATPNSVVVVAFPSLHGVKTFASQWDRAREAGLDVPAVEVLLGRKEFVSRDAVALLVDDPAGRAPHLTETEIQAIEEWALQQDHLPAGAWMMDGLLDLASGLDRDALCINGLCSKTDPGVEAYEAQFARASVASVIACSHHMLAFDVLVRQQGLGRDADFRAARASVREDYFTPEAKAERDEIRAAGVGPQTVHELVAEVALEHERELLRGDAALAQRRLPPYQHLIVDEAHLLEQAFSSCFSSGVSLRETARKLAELAAIDGRKEVRDAAAAAKGACQQMSSQASDGESTSFDASGSGEPPAVTALRTIGWALKAFKPSKKAKEQALPLLAALERDQRVISAALDSGLRSVRILDFSPVRHYPQLTVGQGDVRQPLHMLWAGVRSAVMLSATLYLRRSDGWSSRYVTHLQSVPTHRLKEIPVVEAPWVISPLRGLYLPEWIGPQDRAEKGLRWLVPPGQRDRLEGDAAVQAQEQWLAEVADVVRWVHATAAGAVLVPCTSHDMVRALRDLLSRRDKTVCGGGIKVLASVDYPSLGALRQAGIEAACARQRFVMLATGAAWTGFDFSGQALGLDAPDDNLLTDLVVPRLPFGMNRSITHRRRLEDKTDRTPHEVMSVALLVQQVLGRLVRRPGLQRNRRIFLLDGRLVDPSMANWIAPARKVFEHYPVRSLAKAPEARE